MKFHVLVLVWLSSACADLEQTRAYFHNSHFMNMAATKLRKCADAGYKRVHRKDCDTVEYLTKMKALKRKLSLAPVGLTKSPFKVESTDAAYANYFENYVVTNKPFKAPMESTMSLSLSECRGDEGAVPTPHLVTGDYPLSICTNKASLYKALLVPPVVYNSYNVRVPPLSAPSDPRFVDVSLQWPAIVELLGNQPRPVERCPLSMHMVLWGASEEVSVRVFDMEVASHALQPTMGQPVLHYWTYDHTGHGELNTSAYADTYLKPGEFMFIPHTYLTSFRAAAADSFDKRPTLLRACFFDGSNLNDVRDALGTEGLLHEPTLSLLATLKSHDFDFSMAREVPRQTSLENFLVYPRPAAAVETTSSSEGAEGEEGGGGRKARGRKDFRGWQENARWNFLVSSLTIPQPPMPAVTAVGRTNVSLAWATPYLPDSQDRTKFGVNITACLAESAEAALVKGLLGSRSALADHSVEGCRVVSFPREVLLEETTEDSSEVPVTTFAASLKGLDHNSSYVFRTMIFYGEAGSHPSEWTLPLETLPESVPAGIPSAVVAVPANTSSTHAVLTFTKPYDDGGLSILGYHVHAVHTEKHHHNLWVWNGLYHGTESKGVITIEVRNLIPGASYEFKVSPFNELGNATAEISNIVTTSTTHGGTTLGGHGHESRYNSKVFTDELMKSYESPDSRTFERLTANQPIPGSEVNSDLVDVLIDDIAQTITITNEETGKKLELEVWDSHWSPQLFQVHGHLVWTDPPLANSAVHSSLVSPKRNSNSDASHMHGKVAVVQRGGVPIVTKAMNVQKAGAIACVVLDDGHCQKFDQKCVPGSSKAHGERFAIVDDPRAWRNIKIPVLLVMEKDTDALLMATGLPSYQRMQAIYDARMASEAASEAEL